jgi:hypothetical protein
MKARRMNNDSYRRIGKRIVDPVLVVPTLLMVSLLLAMDGGSA